MHLIKMVVVMKVENFQDNSPNGIKKGLMKMSPFLFKIKLSLKVILLFLLFLLCIFPIALHQSNIERNLLRRTLTKILLLGWLKKVKSLNTVKIQTCFPEFLNVSTNVCLLFFLSNKKPNQFSLKSNYCVNLSWI